MISFPAIGIVQTLNSQQPRVNSQQPTVNSQQPTANKSASGIDITERLPCF
ncbi:hypothetical protein [Tychonema sp. LEGE 07203]|uniref:hypothetical protein n=1 Tax=Tychonema sp. LEGE 07203 TaxID=1828671 RepID=UPI00187F72BE|nr:hypothetical protein [Tychonema sp. LEGE 07203]MBE9094970.1 hypothetical protein [Tychonema sp. LEGE 07203]